jgi:hypothetical protein
VRLVPSAPAAAAAEGLELVLKEDDKARDAVFFFFDEAERGEVLRLLARDDDAEGVRAVCCLPDAEATVRSRPREGVRSPLTAAFDGVPDSPGALAPALRSAA